MAKQHYQDEISPKDRRQFSHLLSDDEEMMILTGLSRMHLIQRFTGSLIFPGIIFIGASLAYTYFYEKNNYLIIGVLSGLLLALIIAFLSMHLRKLSVKYILTNKRVVIKKGIMKINLASAPFDKITQIEIDQGLLEKLVFNHGTIRISIAGLDKGELDLEYIDSPLEFKNILERLIHFERGNLPGGKRSPIDELFMEE